MTTAANPGRSPAGRPFPATRVEGPAAAAVAPAPAAEAPAPAAEAPAPAAEAPARPRAVLSALVALTKPRIVELLLVTTVPTMILARGGWPGTTLVVATVLGGAMAAGGANALNMVYDRDIDAKMRRTRGRPLVTGDLSPAAAAAFATGLEVGGFALLWWQANLLAAALSLASAVFYLVVYTVLLKRSTSQNIVIGGAAGAGPVLAGWAAVTGGLAPAAWLLFAVVFLWTPPHFWALAVKYREDYDAAGVPMLPVTTPPRRCATHILVYTVALVAASLAVGPVAGLGPLYLAAAAVLGAGFLARAAALWRRPTPVQSMKLFRFSISYLGLLFVAVAVGTFVPLR
jgi:protoheme IX farnesyltransferase